MALFLPALTPAYSPNGDALPGAVWEFYVKGTTTPQAITGGAFSVTADGTGAFANAVLDSAQSYRAVLKDADGRVIYDITSVDTASFDAGVKQAQSIVPGEVLPGATWKFTEAGSTTNIQVVYADADLTTPLANPVMADGDGRFPEVYLDTSLTYRAELLEADGTSVDTIDPVTDAQMQIFLAPDSSTDVSYGALSRAQEGAGIAVTGTSIDGGDESGHWQISNGRLYPTTAGDTADMSAGPYTLSLNNGELLNITIEADTWDVATQAEWDVIANQASGTLAGKKIALRNDSALTLGITGAFSTPFRRVDLRDGSTPLTVKGRFGDVGSWDDYCEIDKVQQLRGTQGLRFQHRKTTAVAEGKITPTGESANLLEDITFDDMWVRGVAGDPNGDYSTSSNYPNLNDDMFTSSSSAANSVGNITISNCLIEWCHTAIAVNANRDGATTTITGNEVRYFYEDGIKVPVARSGNNSPATVSDNFIHDPVGLPTDSASQHPDALQFLSVNSVTVDWTNITVERNIILQGTSRGVMQGIFFDDMKTGAGDSGHFFTPTVRNNIVCTSGAAQGIWVGQAKNAVVDNNTVISYGEANTLDVSVLVGDGFANATTGGGNSTTDNIADGLNVVVGETSTGNQVAGRAGVTIAYDTLMDGPTFAPTTIAEVKALLNPTGTAGAVIP